MVIKKPRRESHEDKKNTGTGTGSIWIGHDDFISKCKKLVLSDLFEGMLASAKENLGERENVEYERAEIQSLPYEDASFDIVIANSMLYHVPDIKKGIQEVGRVLKEGGTFYCSTLGENNFIEKLAEWFELGGENFKPNHNFTMQNGKQILQETFSNIESLIYEDSLHITDTEDLVDYLRSLTSFKAILDLPVDRIRVILNDHVINGSIDLPKEYGMFISRKR